MAKVKRKYTDKEMIQQGCTWHICCKCGGTKKKCSACLGKGGFWLQRIKVL